MKTIYKIFIDGDVGELWLDENFNVLSFVHSNDGDFSENYSFIFKYLNARFININIDPSEEEMNKIYNFNQKQIFELFAEKIMEKVEKLKK